jgi:ankyrin repeat protein
MFRSGFSPTLSFHPLTSTAVIQIQKWSETLMDIVGRGHDPANLEILKLDYLRDRAFNIMENIDYCCIGKHASESELVEILKMGANVNYQNFSGATPLMVAAFLGHENMTRILLQCGADPNRKTAEHEEGYTALHGAALSRNENIVRMLIDKGVDVNVRGKRSLQTPLHFACISGYVPIITLLLEHGALINAHSTSGSTSLHMAARFGRCPAVVLLLRKGADPRAQGSHGQTPLDVAKEFNHQAVAEVLHEHFQTEKFIQAVLKNEQCCMS